MSHYVLENCIACKFSDCVEVCPVDCFREGPNFLAIDPEECIDCGLCVSECPANAIKHESDLTPKERIFIQINAELSSKWNVIKKKQTPLPNADYENGKPNKLIQLIK
ncbi:ferredoxin family protein [archaeon]|nr:ferredoxin family protein [archaeon]